jgi:transcriptional regulator with XRE-family HTH domain
MAPPAKQSVRREFAARVVAARRANGWSQDDLAHESGLARSYMSGIERGIRNVSLDNICRLAHALRIKPAQLLDFKVDEPPPKRKQAEAQPKRRTRGALPDA